MFKNSKLFFDSIRIKEQVPLLFHDRISSKWFKKWRSIQMRQEMAPPFNPIKSEKKCLKISKWISGKQESTKLELLLFHDRFEWKRSIKWRAIQMRHKMAPPFRCNKIRTKVCTHGLILRDRRTRSAIDSTTYWPEKKMALSSNDPRDGATVQTYLAPVDFIRRVDIFSFGFHWGGK